MRNKLTKSLIAVSVLAALAGCNSDDNEAQTALTCADAGDACTTFTVLHTNDNHGRFWENKYGEYGMAARKTLIDQIRAEVESNGGETLLLSGGDINTGVPESDLQDARPDFVGMNLIGYDAMAVGNHEFDNELSVVDMQRELANFPMLAANIYETVQDDDGKDVLERYFDAYKIFDINGIKIAVIGLTTEDTAKIGNPEFIKGLTFTDPKVEIKKVIKEIKDAGTADLIFATTHMGHYANAANGSNAPGDVALARAVTEGDLQAIIGGHSQNPVCMEPGTNVSAKFSAGDECAPDQQNGTYIMQAHEWGKYVGRADFEYFNGKLQLASYKLIPVNLKKKNSEGERVFISDEINADATVREMLRPYKETGQEKLKEKIADSTVFLEGPTLVDGVKGGVRFKQTNLGQLIAKAHKTKVSADIAVMNSGGVRVSIEKGEITYNEVLLVQPFGNTITKNTMTGAEVTKYLNTVASLQIGAGAYAQLTGVTMSVDCKAKTVEISDINGKGYEADTKYSLTVPSFNAAGGDGYPNISAEAGYVNTGYVDADVLYTFLKDKKSIASGDFAPINGVLYQNSESLDGCKITTPE